MTFCENGILRTGFKVSKNLKIIYILIGEIFCHTGKIIEIISATTVKLLHAVSHTFKMLSRYIRKTFLGL